MSSFRKYFISVVSPYSSLLLSHKTLHSSRSGLQTGWDTSRDRKSTRLNSSHVRISYAVFCLKKKRGGQQAWQLVLRDHHLGGGAARSGQEMIVHVLGVRPAHLGEPFDDDVLLLRRHAVGPRFMQQERAGVVRHLGDHGFFF